MIMAGGGGEYQLKVGLQWLGAGTPGMPGGGEGGGISGGVGQARSEQRQQIARDKERQEFLKKQTKTGQQHFRSTFGINIGIAAILKQSQIFTGTIGTLFQILGAFIDVILMAFMPIIIPALKLMARLIPYIRKAAENTVGNIIKVLGIIRSLVGAITGKFPDTLKNFFKSTFMNLIAYFFVGTFLARLMGMQKIWFQFLKAYLISPMLRYLGIIAMKIPLLNRLGFVQGMGRAGGFGGAPGFAMGRQGGAQVASRIGVTAAAGAAGQFGGPVAVRAGLRSGTAGVAGMAARTAVATAPAMIPPGTVFGPAIPAQVQATQALTRANALQAGGVPYQPGMVGRSLDRMKMNQMRSLTGRMPKIGLAGGLAITGGNVMRNMAQGDTGGAVGAGVGGMAGMVIGGGIGTLAGPAGTMIGAMLGSAIGTMIGESIGSNMTAHPREKDMVSTATGAGGGYIHASNQNGAYGSRLANQVRG